MRKTHDGSVKALVALEAIMGDRTVSVIAAAYGVHPNQINKWSKQALDKPFNLRERPSLRYHSAP
jgi:transposase-like protein